MSDMAILKDKKVIPTENMTEWGEMFKGKDRLVAKDTIGDADISTVFLGLNHGYGGKKLWFETMIFGGEHDEFQERYATWEEAEAGHKRAVEMVMKK